MTDDLSFYISGGTAIALVSIAGKLAWQASRVEKSMREDFRQEILKLENDARARGDTYRNEFGETCAAIRQKLHEVEVFTRDHFVSKDNFESAVRRMERSFDKLSERLESKLDETVKIIHQRSDRSD